ncbi:methyl-accepting chemotaxis protein [Paenibacillus sp. J2TS4]|uniref:methyl-accepting chemotaxis protein n=1 Tax=Paenibacillus sp. J2TS4 TaxID=2807194 RepID=UPI001B02A31D|nr:methyl-accepting chemotaxis protein [Paenibacillus sp. J2TS4]GIP33745.1 methyl-accepting chemotaxis protein [Paenibacillus sp. J2TS4]
MKNLKLQKQILIPFLSLILLASIILSSASYLFSVNMTVSTLNKNIGNSIEETNRMFERFFRKVEKQLTAISENGMISEYSPTPENEASLLSLFQMYHTANNDITNIYLGTEEGRITLYPEDQTLPSDYDPRTRPWYEEAILNKDQTVWTEPYLNATDGSLVVSAAKAVDKGGDTLGVLAIDVSLNELIELIENIQIGQEGYAVLFDDKGTFLYHPDSELSGADVTQEEYYIKMSEAGEKGVISYNFYGNEKMFSFTTNPTTGWRLAGTVYVNEFKQEAAQLIKPLAIMTIIVLLAAVIISYYFTRRITKPIHSLMASMKEVEQGRLNIRVDLERKDEIGQLASVFNSMVTKIRSLIGSIDQISDKVKEASQTLVANTEENQAASSEITRAVNQIAEGAGQQAELVEQTSEAIYNLADRMTDIETQSRSMEAESQTMLAISQEGMDRITQLKKQAILTNHSMGQIVEAIALLNERTGKISEIVNTVSDIAAQTNLLALNASIEAARAGDAGRGFTIVADEVKKLANQSQDALGLIGSIINEISGETENTLSIIQESNQIIQQQDVAVSDTDSAFRTIMSTVESNTEQIRSIAEHIKETARQKESIIQAMEIANSVTEETAAGTEEVSATVEQQSDSISQLTQLAEELDQLAWKLSEELKHFRIT